MAGKKKDDDKKNKKYILRRAKNNKRREAHASAAMYAKDKKVLKAKAKAFGQKIGYADMSISAYINFKLLLPGGS